MKNKVNYAQAAKCYIFYYTRLRKGNSKKQSRIQKNGIAITSDVLWWLNVI